MGRCAAVLLALSSGVGLSGVIAIPGSAWAQGAPAAAGAQQAPTSGAPAATINDEQQVVARVDGLEIRRSDVLAAIRLMPQQLQQMPADILFPAMLDQVINVRLLAAAGYRQNLQNEPEVKEKVRRAEERAVQEAYLNQALASVVTPEALRAKYADYIAANPAEDEVHARHILVASEEEASRLIRELANGADFDALARRASTDSTTAAKGGDLGWFSQGDMVRPFADAAFSLASGQVGKSPVQSEFGWHVIKVEGRRRGQPPTLEDMTPQLRSEIQQDAVGSLIEDLRAKAKIVKIGPEGNLAAP